MQNSFNNSIYSWTNKINLFGFKQETFAQFNENRNLTGDQEHKQLCSRHHINLGSQTKLQFMACVTSHYMENDI
jgi:hypothetical protein